MIRALLLTPHDRVVPVRTIPKWLRAQDGVAAVEFALVLPVMVAMLLGMTEVTLGVNTDRKLTLLSRSLADLSSRAKELSTSDLSNVFAAAQAVMQPYDSSQVKMVVSSMSVTGNGTSATASVAWSCAKGPGATAKPTTTTYPVPSGFQTNGSYYMLIETSMPYTPMFGRAISGTITLTENTSWPVRNSNNVALTGSCPS